MSGFFERATQSEKKCAQKFFVMIASHLFWYTILMNHINTFSKRLKKLLSFCCHFILMLFFLKNFPCGGKLSQKSNVCIICGLCLCPVSKMMFFYTCTARIMLWETNEFVSTQWPNRNKDFLGLAPCYLVSLQVKQYCLFSGLSWYIRKRFS